MAEGSSFFGSVTNLFGNTIELLGQRAANALEKAKQKDNTVRESQRVSIVSNTEVAQQEARYLDKFSFLSDDSLNLMAQKDAIVAAIIARRCTQVAKFSRPAHKKYQMGYRVELREGIEPDDYDSENIAYIEDYIGHTGRMDETRPPEEWMNFEEFLRRETKDLLTYDRIAIEKVPALDGTVHSFLPVDSGTIRFSRRSNENVANLQETYISTLDRRQEEIRQEALRDRLEDLPPDEIRYVQLMGGRIVSYYSRNDLTLKMFNPTNDVRLNGYSQGPLEKLVAIVTSHLFAESHNRYFFTQGFSTRGILSIKGNIPQQQLDAFRREWYAQVSGAQNSWRTPIVGGEDVEVDWIPMSVNNRDMEWDVWMHYLVKVICALYLIAPQEIGWDVSTTGAGMIAGDSGKRNMVFLTESKDVGLDPILRFYENLINEDLMPGINPEFPSRYIFRFVGFGEDDPSADIERQVRELTNYKKLDEVRLEMGMSPIGPPLGELILNPALLPLYENMLFPQQEEPSGGSKDKKAKKARDKDDRETKSSKKKTRQKTSKKYR